MSPRKPEILEELRETKKEMILHTALHLFAEEGYHNTSISKIAEKAGIAKGLLYNYFKSKEELLHCILFQGIEQITRYFDPNKDGVLEKHELELFIRKTVELIKTNLHHWKLYFSIMTQPSVNKLMVSSSIHEELVENLMSILIDFFVKMNYKNPETEAMLLHSLLDGMVLNYVIDPENFKIDEIKELVIEKYCK